MPHRPAADPAADPAVDRGRVNDALKTAEAICRNERLRFTDLRRKVLKLIWSSPGPAKAYDILARLDSAAAKPPTVYRTLDFLLAHGFVHRLNSLNAYVGCGHPQEHSECYFLVCSGCGEIKECCSGELQRLIEKTAKASRFTPRRTTLEIQGECPRCKRAGRQAGGQAGKRTSGRGKSR